MAGKGKPTFPSSLCRAGRKPGRLPWERSLFTPERKSHCENIQLPPTLSQQDTEPISQQAATAALRTEPGAQLENPTFKTANHKQGLGSPGQSATRRLGHSVPRRGASCDAFSSSPFPSPPLPCPGQSKYHSLRWRSYSAGLSRAHVAVRTWGPQCKRGPGLEVHRHLHRNWAFFKERAGLAISPLLWEAEDDLVLLF